MPTPKVKTPKEQILHRMKILQGHLRAVEKMIEADVKCIDVIHQSMAVQKGLKRLDMALMREHLGTTVIEQFQNNQYTKSIDDLLALFEVR
jgi:CsoR family transcriptional regulator, copper-sensing transcriptional repressor